MSVELAVVTFDGTSTAKKQLSRLRRSRDDTWLAELAVLEHRTGGRSRP